MNNREKKSFTLKKVLLIIFSIVFLILSIFNIISCVYTNNKDQEILSRNHYNKSIQCAEIIQNMNDSNAPYYPQVSFNLDSTSFVRLFSTQNKLAWCYLNDNQTFIYHDLNTSSNLLSFHLTNGINTYWIARYSYTTSNGGIHHFTLVDGSDGYLSNFKADSYNFVSYYTFNLTSLLIVSKTRPDYVSAGINMQVYELVIGTGSNDNAYKTGYDKGYVDGLLSGFDYVSTDPNTYGLYTSEQFESNYSKGYNDGVASVQEQDLSTNGLKTLMSVILNSPFNILHGFLNFDIFGINLFAVLSFVFTCSLAFFIIKLIFLKK